MRQSSSPEYHQPAISWITHMRKLQLRLALNSSKSDENPSLSDEPKQLTSNVKMQFHKISNAIGPLLDSKLFMLLIMMVTITIYLWGAPQAIDYPMFDESSYLGRAVSLLRGNWAAANMGTLNATPLHVVLYAVWYSLLRTSLVYPWVFITSTVMLAVGSFVLFAKAFHPVLSWFLATLTVVCTAMLVSNLANYLLGPGILWFGLGLVGKRVRWRVVAIIVAIIATYVRAEFLLVDGFMIIGMLGYEAFQIRQHKTKLRGILLAYSPVAVLLAATLALATMPRTDKWDHSMEAFVWSYADYVGYLNPAQPRDERSVGTVERWDTFRKDFGDAQTPLQALINNPGKILMMVTIGSGRMWDGFAGTLFRNTGMHAVLFMFDQSTTTITLSLILAVIIIGGGAAISYVQLRKTNRLATLPMQLDVLTLIPFFSLITLLPLIVTITPEIRFLMMFPLFLLPLGVMVTLIVHQLRVSRSLLVIPIVIVLVLMPRPFAQVAQKPVAAALDMIRQYVPEKGSLLSFEASTYGSYFYAENRQIDPANTYSYPDPVFVNAYKAHPKLRYILFTSLESTEDYDRWFAQWNAAYPGSTWEPIASNDQAHLKLYHLRKRPKRTTP